MDDHGDTGPKEQGNQARKRGNRDSDNGLDHSYHLSTN